MVGGKSPGERVFNISNVIIMIVLMVVTIYPFWYSVIASLNGGSDLVRGPLFMWPRVFTWASWRAVLADPGLLQTAWITISRTVIVTVVSILYTAICVRLLTAVPEGQEAIYDDRICQHVF
jgi:putative aldouronate transport system permease protein